MKTIKIELRNGKFSEVKVKGLKGIQFTKDSLDLDGWHCEVDSYGDITCEYTRIEKGNHYIVTYSLTHDGQETVYTKKTNCPSRKLVEQKVATKVRNGTIYLIDLPKVHARSAYYKPARIIKNPLLEEK